MDAWVIAVIAIGSVASAIISIWILMERISKKFNTIVDKQIEKSLTINEELQEQRFLRIVEKMSYETNNKIDNLTENFNSYKQEQAIEQAKKDEQDKLLVSSILAVYKQEIRDIYYKLTETGIISNQDKEYIDRIYPLYFALGGNSDITQKIGEIQRVVERRTQEAFDKAYEANEKEKKDK